MNPHAAACLAARATLEEHPGHDHPPVLQLVGTEALMSVCTDSVDRALRLAEALVPLVAWQGVVLVADSWHTTAADPAEVPPGSVRARGEAGDPTVHEALVVHSHWRTRPPELTILPYRRHADPGPDGWRIEWLTGGTDRDDASCAQGRVSDALAAAMAEPMREPPDGRRASQALVMYVIAALLETEGAICDVMPLGATDG